MPETPEQKSLNNLPAPIRWMVAAATYLFVAFAAPIRGMYDIIQNAWVTSFGVISVAAILIYGGAEVMHGEELNEIWAQHADHMSERARNMRINNDKLDPPAKLGKFGAAVGNKSNDGSTDGLLIAFQPVPGATVYTVEWQQSAMKGILNITDTTVDADGFIRFFIPAADFKVGTAPGWPVAGGNLSFSLYAANSTFSTKATRQHVRIMD